MLASRLGSFEQLRVADLYAGSGALGLEALSRGAAFACFVERDPRAAAAIRANAGALGATERVQIVQGSVDRRPSEPFHLVLADPPYGPGSGSAALASLVDHGWAATGAWIAIETKRGDRVESSCGAVDCERDVGPARLTLVRR